MNTTSDLLEEVSASYIPIQRQQDLSLTALNFPQLRMEITQSVRLLLLHNCVFRVVCVHVKVIKVLLLSSS